MSSLLLLVLSADVRSSDDAIATEGYSHHPGDRLFSRRLGLGMITLHAPGMAGRNFSAVQSIKTGA